MEAKRVNKKSHKYYLQFEIWGNILAMNTHDLKEIEPQLKEIIEISFNLGREHKLQELKKVLEL